MRRKKMVHGGLSENHHYQYIEDNAHPDGMGREILRGEGGGYPADMISDKHDGMMKAWPARGSRSNYHKSKWSKRGGR